MSKNRKIALISAYNYNYGTVLQAISLAKIVSKYNDNIEIISYKKKISLMQIKRITNFNLVSLKMKILYRRIRIKNKNWGLKKNRRFKDFLEENIRFSEEIVGYEQLKERIKDYDVVLLGSDQLWNPINIGTHYFTLEFVPDSTPKHTYATSFGVTSLEKKDIITMKRSLKRINSISVREEQGARLINSICPELDVRVDLDPTMLLSMDEWNQIIPSKRLTDDKYVFAYFVGSQVEYRKIVEWFAHEYGYKIILLPHIDEYVKYDSKFENETSMSTGPKEFINLIRYADYVFTDSFHGCVFSVLFHKCFFPFARFRQDDKESMNSRLENLFNMIKLNNHMCFDKQDVLRLKNKDINYDDIDKILATEREHSISYLKSLFFEDLR